MNFILISMIIIENRWSGTYSLEYVVLLDASHMIIERKWALKALTCVHWTADNDPPPWSVLSAGLDHLSGGGERFFAGW